MMKNYNIEEKYLFTSESVSKGTQKKYKKDDYFYKLNKLGDEGFSEYLVSCLLKASDLPPHDFVCYEYCKINSLTGCRSYNFLKPEEEFISMNRLYKSLTGNSDLGIFLQTLYDAKERLEYLLWIVTEYGIDKKSFRKYINTLVQLDLLCQNTDRHVFNYGIIYSNNNNHFRTAPIFDNGKSLDTDRSGDTASKTLSGSLEDQVTAFGFPVTACFKIDYTLLQYELNTIEKEFGNRHELIILRQRLDKYKNIFKK